MKNFQWSAGQPLRRRDAVYGLAASLGSVAFTAVMASDLAKETPAAEGPLQPKPQQLPAKAQRCIFLMMEGGPSHIDTFDPKPKLADLHLEAFVRNGQDKSAMESGERYYVQSPFRFRRAGESGVAMAENWEHLAGVADDELADGDRVLHMIVEHEQMHHETLVYMLKRMPSERMVPVPSLCGDDDACSDRDPWRCPSVCRFPPGPRTSAPTSTPSSSVGTMNSRPLRRPWRRSLWTRCR